MREPLAPAAADTAHCFDQYCEVSMLFEVLFTLMHSSSTRICSPAVTPRENWMLPCSGAPGRGSAVSTSSVAAPCRRALIVELIADQSRNTPTTGKMRINKANQSPFCTASGTNAKATGIDSPLQKIAKIQ